jgi:hypothetical protein
LVSIRFMTIGSGLEFDPRRGRWQALGSRVGGVSAGMRKARKDLPDVAANAGGDVLAGTDDCAGGASEHEIAASGIGHSDDQRSGGIRDEIIREPKAWIPMPSAAVEPPSADAAPTEGRLVAGGPQGEETKVRCPGNFDESAREKLQLGSTDSRQEVSRDFARQARRAKVQLGNAKRRELRGARRSLQHHDFAWTGGARGIVGAVTTTDEGGGKSGALHRTIAHFEIIPCGQSGRSLVASSRTADEVLLARRRP